MEEIKLNSLKKEYKKNNVGLYRIIAIICFLFLLVCCIFIANIKSDIGLTLLIFTIILCLVLSAIFFGSSFLIHGIYEISYENLNTETLEILKEKGYKITKVFYLENKNKFFKDDITKKMIFCDIDKKITGLIDYKSNILFICLNDEILNCELYENSSVATSGSSSGNYSFFSSYSVSSHTNYSGTEHKKINNLCLNIKIKTLTMPQIVYEIYSSKNYGCLYNDSSKYTAIIESMQQVKSYFDILEDENKLSKTKRKFIYCRYCGAKNNEDDKKCSSCGSNL